MYSDDIGHMTDQEEMVNMAEAMAQECIKKIELQAELKFAKRFAAISAVMIEKIEKHTESRNDKFEMLDSFITSAAFDVEEDTLGEGGPLTTILNTAHIINDADVEFFKQTIADLKNKLPGEAYVHKINNELSAIAEREKAIAEREKAIDKLFEESEDEETIKDEEAEDEEIEDEKIKDEEKVNSINKDKPTAEASQLLPSPNLLQNPSTTQTTVPTLDDDVHPRDFSLQPRIQDYIEEAVGNVDDRVHRLFKDVALRTSLYILENVPGHDSLLSVVNSQININERNARAVNRSLEGVLNAHDPTDTRLMPKATDHCKLLDKQEKERQKALEGMLEKFEQRKRDKAEVMEAIGTMRQDIKEERDNCNRKEMEGVRKLYGEQTKENSRGDDGDDTMEDQASRKRKRDVGTEERIDVDMLM
ncbi:hypothetical protein KCU98_g3402, partial [Aureobasidium melanogenum]